ncbi:putative DNA-directed RNA polymerase domain protein [Burkholderia pseudomallei MSHR4375]|uniref:hypothetical protein n=1 Tax=Burkholderia pseudomallei TaxID=28450 RepID=UPI000537F28C|nr:hypothetical protein [Burkholderia pseudomallei]KGV79812.1 putative DNA-directed RNA polymerase domain protein [Burkholderia pseudomallei MSHR4375]
MTSKPTDDLLQRCRELLELNEKGESQQTALRALAATYDREIPAHDRRTMAVSQTHLEAMRALLAARPAESWQVEIDAYKREVRELEAVLRIPEKMEDDWIRADVQRPIEAGIPSDDDVLAWNNDPGFATIIEASFISQSFPEYTHWKKKPEAPADIDHAKGVVHDR